MNRVIEGGRLAAFGAAYFFAAGAFMSYWPVWLRDRGITDAEIGTLFMARQLVSVVVDAGHGLPRPPPRPARAACCWRWRPPAIVMMGAYQISYTFLALLLVGLVWGCVWSPTMALYDGVLVNEAQARAASSTARCACGARSPSSSAR